MAGKLTDLPSASPVGGDELIEIVQNGANKKLKISDLTAIGANGKSAYELAVLAGFQGTNQQWLNSLVGPAGTAGTNGQSAYTLAVNGGYVGTPAQWITSLKGDKGDTGIQGPAGLQGTAGATGAAGKSAYQVAVDSGYSGDITTWLSSLKGEKGNPGDRGVTGATGNSGADGKSAYQLALDGGFVGTQTAWINSLKGLTGNTGAAGATGPTGNTGLQGATGAAGAQGTAGKSAYQSAVDAGYVGNETAWIASLKGAKGDTGTAGSQGISAYQSALNGGFVGTEVQWITSLKGTTGNTGAAGATGPAGTAGVNGKSAYELAVQAGYSGTQSQWITSLKGDLGATGPAGATGSVGPQGVQGPQGIQGTTGISAYQSAVLGGFSGTEAQWVTSLKGVTGNTGATGPTGARGDQGLQGVQGAVGPAGATGPTGATGPQGPAGPTGAAGSNGASTVSQISDASSVGKNVMLAASAIAGRTALSAAGFDATTKILDTATKAALNISGLDFPGVVNGVDYGIDWNGTESASAFQNWINAAAAYASSKISSNGKMVSVKLTLPQGAVLKLASQVTFDVSRVHIDLNGSHIVFTNNAAGGFLVKSTGYDVGVSGMYHQGKEVLTNGCITGPGRSTCTYTGVMVQGNTDTNVAFYEMSPAGSVFSNLSVTGFDKGFTFDYWCYLITLVKIDLFGNNTSIFQGANFSGGERMAMRDSNLSNCSYGIDFTAGAGCEWMIDNCSMDFCGVHIQWKNTVAINLSQCHLEHGSGNVPLIQGLDGYQGGGVSLVQTDLVSSGGYNTYTNYIKLSGRNFFDMDHCYLSNVRGITNEFCGDYTSRTILGTVSCTGNSATITGVGTTFTTALAVGDLVTFSNSSGQMNLGNVAIQIPRLKVKSIESDTSLTLVSVVPTSFYIGTTNATAQNSMTNASLRASTAASSQGGRVKMRNTKFGPNAFNDFMFVGGDTRNYLLYDATGGAPHGFVEQAGNFVVASANATKPFWTAGTSGASGYVTLKTNNPFPIPSGQSYVNISGMVPAAYNGSFLATKVDNNTVTYPMPFDPGVVADNMTAGRINMGAVFGNNYGIRLGTGFGLTVVSNGGYLEFRKNANYTGTNCAFWLMIPIPSAAFRNVVFGFDEVAVGAVGTVQVLTRWGAYPNVQYSGYGGTIPDDAIYNNSFSDPGGYTPSSVETTQIFNVPEYSDYSAAPESATHFVVKFALASLNNYAAGSVVYKIRNIRASMM